MAFLVLLFSDFYITGAGNNLYEAVENAKEFLGLALLMFETANEALPNPTPQFEVRTKSVETAVRLKVNLIDARER